MPLSSSLVAALRPAGPLPSISLFHSVLVALSLTDGGVQVGLLVGMYDEWPWRGALPAASTTTAVVEDFPYWSVTASTHGAVRTASGGRAGGWAEERGDDRVRHQPRAWMGWPRGAWADGDANKRG
uniref:Uncharacterized protein n=1 Tax=Oryza brachyantha TaxID=4533 RepID=J3L0P6_ORYBR